MKKPFLTLLLLTITTVITTMSIAPAYAEYTVLPGEPFDREYHFEILPGAQQSATIKIKNLGNSDLNVKVYGIDATSSNQGTFALKNSTAEQLHIGKWVNFTDPSYSIAPQAEKIIPFQLTVPETATPGSYAGGIAVESSSDAFPTTEADSKGGGSMISVTARQSVKLFLKVPGEKIHKYEWKSFEFKPSVGNLGALFNFSFSNSGNTIVVAEPHLEITGFPALKNKIIDLPVVTIQPQTELNNIEKRWDEIPSWGFYRVKASVTFYEFDIGENKNINPDNQFREIPFINLTSPFLTIGLAALILFLLIFFIIKYIQYLKLISSCAEYTVKQDDTLAGIAELRGIKWKKLAKINNIKPPYILKTGQVILAPALGKTKK